MGDPLVARELSGYSRRWQTYLVRVLYVAVIGAVVYRVLKVSPYFSVSDFANLSRTLFDAVVAAQTAFITLAAVLSAADMIVREVRGRAIDLLLLSPLTPWKILFGKWKAALAQSATLVLCGVPVLAGCVYLGGVGPLDLLAGVSVSLSSAAMGAGFALFLSTTLRSWWAASVVAILVVGAVAVVPVFPHTLAIVHNQDLAAAWLASILIGAWVGLTMVYVASECLVDSTTSPAGASTAKKPADRARPPDRHELPGLRRLTSGTRLLDADPLLWKELVLRPAARVRREHRVQAGFALLMTVFLSWVFTFHQGLSGMYFWMAVLLLVVIVTGVGLFIKEKEGRQWDLLLSTPLSRGRILRSKLLAGAVAPESQALGLMAVFILALWTARLSMVEFVKAGVSIGLFLGFAYLLSAAISLQARSMREAILYSLGIVLGLLAVPPALCSLFAGRPGAADCLVDGSRLIHPVLALDASRAPGSEWTALLGYAGVYGLAIVLLLGGMVLRFRPATGRA